MKKLYLILLLSALIILPSSAENAASGGYKGATANASIVAPHTVKVTAPYSGTLLPFSIAQGDNVAKGDTLFEIDTVKVYAPQSGTLSAVFADIGDDAQGVVLRYGALAMIEPELPLYLDASTSGAYNDSENKYLHVGERLYLKQGSDKGTGRVTSVDEKKYTVEVLSGKYEVGDSVKCYRESGFANDSVTGTGKVKRYPDVPVMAIGRVLKMHKLEGDTVKAGELLFEMVDASSPPGPVSVEISAGADGAVASLYAISGAQVYKGQLLCEITDLTRLELRCEIDEIYLDAIKPGDSLEYSLDAYPNELHKGVVTEIRPIGIAKQNATYYDVRLTVTGQRRFLPGMNATVYID